MAFGEITWRSYNVAAKSKSINSIAIGQSGKNKWGVPIESKVTVPLTGPLR